MFCCGVDYRDRWRLDEFGRPKLSLRRLAVLVRNLPATAEVRAIERGGPDWPMEAHLLDDVRMILLHLVGVEGKSIKPHPLRPREVIPADPEREKKLLDALNRKHERDKRLAEK